MQRPQQLRRPRHSIDVETNVCVFIFGHDEHFLAAFRVYRESVP